MALLLSFWFFRKNLLKGKAPFFSTSFEFYTIYFTPPLPLCDVTQQLYLDMISWHEWLDLEREKRLKKLKNV